MKNVRMLLLGGLVVSACFVSAMENVVVQDKKELPPRVAQLAKLKAAINVLRERGNHEKAAELEAKYKELLNQVVGEQKVNEVNNEKDEQ